MNYPMRVWKDPRGLAVSSLCLVVIVGSLVSVLTPATDLVRFRNALIAESGSAMDFQWTPANRPADYRQETLVAPGPLQDWAKLVPPASEPIDLAETIVRHLRERPKRKGPIKSTTVIAYREITENGRGYCADYTQVFNGLAHAFDLPVREWGMSFDSFSGDGHAFNEVWDDGRKQWIFVDPLNGFYVQDSETGRPLSVLEFRDRLLAEQKPSNIAVVTIGQAFRFDSEAEAFLYYRDGVERLFLWLGNDVFSYDSHPLVKTLGPISRSLEQLAAITWGIHPRMRILTTPTNKQEVRELARLPYIVGGLVLAATGLTILIIAQILSLASFRRARTRRMT